MGIREFNEGEISSSFSRQYEKFGGPNFLRRGECNTYENSDVKNLIVGISCYLFVMLLFNLNL